MSSSPRRPVGLVLALAAFVLLLVLASTGAQAFVVSIGGGRRSHLHGAQARISVAMAAADGADEQGKKRRGWPVGRALKTFLQFNGPRLFRRNRGKGAQAPPEEAGAAVAPSLGQGLPLAHGVVLVTGATGGVGKRVVELLIRKGLRVRALARNKQKALALLNRGQEPEKGGRLEVVQADVSNPQQLNAAVMEGVAAVVACTAAIVQPKQGDTEDRARYYQGGWVGGWLRECFFFWGWC